MPPLRLCCGPAQTHDGHAGGKGEPQAQVAKPDHRAVNNPHALGHGFQGPGRIIGLDDSHVALQPIANDYSSPTKTRNRPGN